MPNYTKPYADFVNNVDVADAVKVNAQINQLYTAINGGLDGTNVNTTGAPFNTYVVKPPVGAPWIAPTLLNAWVNFGGAYTIAGYYKDDLGIVHIKGVIKSGTATSGTGILMLPAGYRPLEQLVFDTVSNDLFGEFQITAAGSLAIIVGSAVSFVINCSFRSEQ